MDALLQALINGLLVGGIYGLLGLGLSLVFGTMRLLNFAQPAFIMVGMYAAYLLWNHFEIDPFLGSLPAFLIAFAIGYLIFRAFVARVVGHNELAQIFLTVGILICLDSLALILFGPATKSVQTPYQLSSLRLGEVTVNLAPLLAFLITIVATGLLYLLLKRTRFGQALQATAQNPVAAELVGINVSKSYATAFAIGVGLTGFAGAILLPSVTVFPTVGMNYAVVMFAVVVLGGLDNPHGALIGGVVIGITQQVSTLFWPASVQNLAVFVVFLATLTFRPYGILTRGARLT